jgi:hypothetical protein
MGDHDEPASWLDRWRDTEPLRLHLYGITVPLLAVCVTYGWLTTEQLGAWLAVAAALFLGSTLAGELARRVVWAPASVAARVAQQDELAYADGREDAERRAAAAETELQPATAFMGRLDRCRRVENGDRCTLPAHPEGVEHRFD